MSLGKKARMHQDSAMHRVVIVALDDVVPADVAGPYEVLSRVHLAGGKLGYRVRVCGVRREVTAGPFHLQLRYGLEELSRADTVLLPGIDDPASPIPEGLVRAVQRAARRGARVV
ncbi:MAG TPA: AraC family transcriptional regulator, partial [Polyangiales bacterium]